MIDDAKDKFENFDNKTIGMSPQQMLQKIRKVFMKNP